MAKTRWVKRRPVTKADLTEPKDVAKDMPMSKSDWSKYSAVLRSRSNYVPAKAAGGYRTKQQLIEEYSRSRLAGRKGKRSAKRILKTGR